MREQNLKIFGFEIYNFELSKLGLTSKFFKEDIKMRLRIGAEGAESATRFMVLGAQILLNTKHADRFTKILQKGGVLQWTV